MGVCSARAADKKFIELGWDMATEPT